MKKVTAVFPRSEFVASFFQACGVYPPACYWACYGYGGLFLWSILFYGKMPDVLKPLPSGHVTL